MVVCQYFLRGSCKFGNQCRNEHPQGGQGDRRPAPGGSTWTPSNAPKTIPFSLETMTRDFDLRTDKPSWSLSSYGPAKNEKNILPPLDESPEELHLKAVTAMRNGNIDEYLQYERNTLANAEQVFTNARNDIKGAFEAAKRQSLGLGTDATSTTSAFTGTGSGSGPAFGAGDVSAFGHPSVFGLQNSGATSPFGQPQGTSAFGTSAFGAPAFSHPSVPKSNFGGAPMNSGGFSAFAGPGPSAFATAANNLNAPAGPVFGQSAFSTSAGAQQPQSAIGTVNSAPTSSAFGRPTAFGSTSGSVFGQPSPFGVAGSPTSAFGQPTSTSAFGQTSTASSNPLTPFGQPTATPSAFSHPTSAFGQPPAASAFSQPAATTSPFGQRTAYTSPFGVAAQQSTFGQVVSPSNSSAAPNSQAKSVAPEFLNAKSTYKPGMNPYDALLPANYSSLLPDSVRAAFAAPQFTWDNVPDWIPPLDMR